MKKSLLCLGMIFLFSISTMAQNDTFAKASMVVIVSQAKSTFTTGISYKEWLAVQFGNGPPSYKEEAFLKDVYMHLSSGSNAEAIFKNYNGSSLLALAKEKNGNVLNSNNAKCGFWCSIVKFIIELVIDLDKKP